MNRPPQWQCWTLTLPAGVRRPGGEKSEPVTFDVFIPNLYEPEMAFRALLDRQDDDTVIEAYMEHRDPPAEVVG